MARITGTQGNDSIYSGTTFSDTVASGAGEDYVQASGGNDSYTLGWRFSSQYVRYGHGDFDTLDYRYVWNNLGLASDTGVSIVADLQAGWIRKYDAGGVSLGLDTVVGLDGLNGTQAADTIRGRDTWSFEQFRGYGGNDTIDGRGNEDSVSYSYAVNAAITVNLAAGTVTSTDWEIGTDTLRAIESVVGTRFADTYDATGYSASSLNRNSFGADWNVYSPNAGNDTVIGNGQTILNYSGVGGAISIDLSALADVTTAAHVVTSFTADTDPNSYLAGDILVSGVNMLISGNGDDVLTGGGRVNTTGASADRTLSGDASYEQFRGQGGNDTISGATGMDRADYRQGVPMVEGIEVRLAAGIVTGDGVAVGTDTLRGIESIRGTHLDDFYDATGFTLANAASRSVNHGDLLVWALPGETLASQAFNEFVTSGGNDTVLGNGATRVTIDPALENLAGVSSVAVFTSAAAGYADYGLTDGGLGRVTFSGTPGLRGGLGNDSFTGAAGHQNLSGGQGNDTLLGGSGADILYGNTGSGTGQIDVAALLYTDDDSLDGGLGNDLLRGDAGRDTLRGDAGHDTIEGGTGVDSMYGGLGNDSYQVDSAGDVVVETGETGSGIDTVTSSVSRTLGSFQENLTLSGSASISGTGNTLGNVLRGNGAANVLNGGTGADSMYGGLGNDTCYVDDAADLVVEYADGGVDTVVSTVSRLLGNYQENLTLTGTAAIDGTGNTLANVLRGNDAANLLGGGSGDDSLLGNGGNDALTGGLGRDAMTGGAGNDRFAFLTASESTLAAYDRILDFARGADKIDLSLLDANAVASGVQDFAFIGSAAFGVDATGQLRYAYNAANGSLMLYGSTDADAAAEFAVQLSGTASLAATDFLF